MKPCQRVLHSAIALAVVSTASSASYATLVTGWNTAGNVVTSTNPDGSGQSVIYDRDPTSPNATTSGKVIFDGDEATSPGLTVENDDFSAGGSSATGCIRASSSTTCDGPFQSGKRFKNVLTGTGPVDFVFDTDPSPNGVNTDPYRVFHRLINDTGSEIVDFVISLGNGVGGDFVQSRSDDGLSFATNFLFRDPTSTTSPPSTLPATTQFPFGLFGDADDNNNFDLDGFFAPERTGFNLTPFDATQENDQITSNGIFGPYSSVFGPWMSLEDVREGAFWDDDGNPDTDNLLIAWLNDDGLWEQRRDFGGDSVTGLQSIDPVTFASFDLLETSFTTDCASESFQFCGFTSGEIEDLANLNVNYAINVASYQGESFTLRVQANAVPAPATLALFGLGFLGLAWSRRRA